jgi:hypothetical protein
MKRATSSPSIEPLSAAELDDLNVPVVLAAMLSNRSFVDQAKVIRGIEGFSPLPIAAWGLTVTVDSRQIVLNIEPD